MTARELHWRISKINARLETDYKMQAKLHGLEYKTKAPRITSKDDRDLIAKAIAARSQQGGRR